MIRNTTTSPILPSTSTYASGTFYIEPTLPSGLMFNSTTGEISGRPNVNMTLTSYAMIFANEFGHDERMFDLIIYEPAADVVYPGSEIQLIRGESSLDWIPSYQTVRSKFGALFQIYQTALCLKMVQ